MASHDGDHGGGDGHRHAGRTGTSRIKVILLSLLVVGAFGVYLWIGQLKTGDGHPPAAPPAPVPAAPAK
jgi:hypothetical protein